MSIPEFVVWMYGITWAGVVTGIAVSKDWKGKKDGQ